MVRTSARQRKMTIRVALGAGRGRLVRQMLIESGILALLGAAAGVLLGKWGTGAFALLRAPRWGMGRIGRARRLAQLQ